MAFLETPRFPEEVSPWIVGGEEFVTDIVATQGGYETRNQVWEYPLRRYSLSNALRTIANAQATKAFFRGVAGRVNGFRVKDTFDYQCDITTGSLGTTAIGTGLPTYQLFKRYGYGSLNSYSKVTKPVSAMVSVYKNTVLQVVGGGAGQIAIDYTTGIITFQPTTSLAVSSYVVGATTQVWFASNPVGYVAGQFLFLSGITGTGGALLNGIAHTITSVTPSTAAITAITKAANAVVTSPGHGLITGQSVTFSGVGGMTQINGLTGLVTFISSTQYSVNINSTAFSTYTSGGIGTPTTIVFVLPVNTTGKTLIGGSFYAYPQAADALVWAGEFDIAVRFDMDWLEIGIDQGLMLWDNVTLVELRL